MNFKSNEELIARVTGTLSSYQAAGLLDEGNYYRWIKEVLTRLNIAMYSPVHTVATLNKNTLEVPDDLVQLWAIWRYEEETQYVSPEKHYQGQARWTVNEQLLEHHCEECNDIWKEGDIMVIKEYVETGGYSRTRKFKDGAPIKIVSYGVNQCSPDSPALLSQSNLEGYMTDKKFTFNFTGGSVYLQYFTMRKDEYGPMIPDVTEIELAIEAYIIWKYFQELFIKGTVDVLQRLQYTEAKWIEAFRVATKWTSLPTARGMIEYNAKNKNRNKLFELKHSRD